MAIACAVSQASAASVNVAGTWYWRSLESATNRWHSAQGEGTLSMRGDAFELDLRDGGSGILAYQVKGRLAGGQLKAVATVPDSDRETIALTGDIHGVDTRVSGKRQTIILSGPYTVLALTRDGGAPGGGDAACTDRQFDTLIARGARAATATREFLMPREAWKLGDNAACATVVFHVGADGHAQAPRVVESYPEGPAGKAALQTIQGFTFQAPAQTELALRFRVYHPATD